MANTLPPTLATEVSPEEAPYLQQQLAGTVDLVISAGHFADIDTETLARSVIVMPFIHTHIGTEDMERMPALKLIATRSTGYDHVDLAAAKARGITVCNVPGYGENAVAEYTFALLLALTRKITIAQTRTRQGDFTLEGLRGFDLYGKTMGIIGTGAIGIHAIRIARGFGMNVLAYDVRQNTNMAEVLGYRYVSLDDLLAASDIISLHAPALPSTIHMINRESLGKVKRGSVLINTARGALVETEALAWALDTGILAGAGLDVLEGEEFLNHEEELLQESNAEAKLKMLVSNHILQRRQNVIITPHVAFNTDEALRRILDTTIDNVKAFITGTPVNTVR